MERGSTKEQWYPSVVLSTYSQILIQYRALQNQKIYLYKFDYELKRLNEYKVTLFAEDDHFCHTSDITTFFNTSSIEPTPKSEAAKNLGVQQAKPLNMSLIQ
ncbi:unnamed protein product, partial [Strongylus vulgaris]